MSDIDKPKPVDPVDPNDPDIIAARKRKQEKDRREAEWKRRKKKIPVKGVTGKPSSRKTVEKKPEVRSNLGPLGAVGLKNQQGAQTAAQKKVDRLADRIANGELGLEEQYKQAKQSLNKSSINVTRTVTPIVPKPVAPIVNPSDRAKTNSLMNTPTLREGTGGIDWANAFDFSTGDGTILFAPNSTLAGGQATPIAFIGDSSGKYLADTTKQFATGSPMSLEAARSLILNRYLRQDGGIVKLKQLLADHGFYGSVTSGTVSIGQGVNLDPLFNSAFTLALQNATQINAQAYVRNPNQSILSFEDAIKNIHIADPNAPHATTTRSVSYQKFKPEQFDLAIDQLFQQTTGMGATDEQTKAIVDMLQKHANKNPSVTITHTSASGNSRTTSSGGMDQNTVNSLLQKEALKQPGAESYTKATKYLSMLNDIVRDPMSLGNM